MALARKLLLAASTNQWLRERATRTAFVRRSVSAFMPGEELDDAIAAAGQMGTQGIGAILTKLGENVTSADEAEAVTRHYLGSLDRIQQASLDAHISIKPTQLGLDLDPELSYRNLQRLVERASARGGFVWIDMESSPYVDRTIELFRRVRAGSTNVGVALQAYLYRTDRDLDSLLPLGSAIRLVKGAYLESPQLAIPKKADVDENYYRLACRLLGDDAQRAGTFLQVGTHDRSLVDRLNAFISERKVPAGAYEYAMLYGIQRGLQMELARTGRRIRVLISYGEYWFPWYMRRLAERPANVWFVVKNIVGG